MPVSRSQERVIKHSQISGDCSVRDGTAQCQLRYEWFLTIAERQRCGKAAYICGSSDNGNHRIALSQNITSFKMPV